MTDLDEEAKRLAAAHPWAATGATETHRTDWQPQHAVPRRPAVPKPTDADIEARVAADLAAIDRELDPQASRVFGGLLTRPWQDVARYQMTATDVLRQQDWFASPQHWNYVFNTNPDPLTGGWIHDDFDTIDATQWSAIRCHAEKLARLEASYGFGTSSFRITEDEADRYRTPKQRKPKTYVAPGRKAGRTWIARLEQSKQARKR